MTIADRLAWLQSATQEELERAVDAGEFDHVYGPGEVTEERAEVLELIERHYPALDLRMRVCQWYELEGGQVGLAVDQSVLLTRDGSDLLVTGATPDGRICCWRIPPSGEARLMAAHPSPLLADYAAMN